MLRRSELRDRRFDFGLVEQAKPHRNRRQDAGDRHQLVVAVDGESKGILLLRPKRIVHQTSLVLKLSREVVAQVLLAHSSSQIRKSSQSLGSNTTLIELSFHRKQRTALDPTVPHAEVHGQA